MVWKLWNYFFFLLLEHLDAKRAGDLSTLFDVGGIFGKLEYQSLIRPVYQKTPVHTAYMYY